MSGDVQGTKQTPEQAWKLRLGSRHSGRSSWHGYKGHWNIYSNGGPSQEAQAVPAITLEAIRTFKFEEESEETELLHVNLYSMQFHFGDPQKRAQDELWEDTFSYSTAEPSASCSIRLAQDEAESGLKPHQVRRMLCTSENAYVMGPCVLPPDASPSAEGQASPLNIPWGFEAFLHGDEWRWSMGRIYTDRAFSRHFLIRERRIDVQPEEAIDLSADPLPEARPMLLKDPAEWPISQGTWHGHAKTVAVGEDGAFLQPVQSDVAWSPPAVEDTDYALFTYPDAMYSYGPGRLPPLSPSSNSGAAGNLRVEFGGDMRSGVFRRLVLTFSLASGNLETAVEETYTHQA